mmetsp:Transcript_40965/g.130933  ORF Transcript_40965/g.130933 Transcript_40965/m.130933 type:complete len:287 (-) Transcript_40965:1831-2691(-)
MRSGPRVVLLLLFRPHLGGVLGPAEHLHLGGAAAGPPAPPGPRDPAFPASAPGLGALVRRGLMRCVLVDVVRDGHVVAAAVIDARHGARAVDLHGVVGIHLLRAEVARLRRLALRLVPRHEGDGILAVLVQGGVPLGLEAVGVVPVPVVGVPKVVRLGAPAAAHLALGKRLAPRHRARHEGVVLVLPLEHLGAGGEGESRVRPIGDHLVLVGVLVHPLALLGSKVGSKHARVVVEPDHLGRHGLGLPRGVAERGEVLLLVPGEAQAVADARVAGDLAPRLRGAVAA